MVSAMRHPPGISADLHQRSGSAARTRLAFVAVYRSIIPYRLVDATFKIFVSRKSNWCMRSPYSVPSFRILTTTVDADDSPRPNDGATCGIVYTAFAVMFGPGRSW